MGVGAVLITTVWLGVFAYREVAFTGDLWWRFALRADAPRFLRSSVAAASVLLLFGVLRLLQPGEPEEATPPEEIPPEVEDIVAREGRASARLAFLGDKAFLFSTRHDAFVMFGVEKRSWVSMGDPVGDPEAFPDLLWDFRNRVYRHGGWPVFYQTTPQHLPLYVDLGLGLIKSGEEAVIELPSFTMEGSRRSGLRQTVRRTERAGGTFEVLAPEAVEPSLGRLREISDAWLEAKKVREKGFSLGSFSREYLKKFPLALLRVEGRPVAFTNLFMGPEGTECAPDLMRYDPEGSPDSAMEYLFIQCILWAKEQGMGRFSLGMAPLSGLAEGRLAPSWSRIGATLFRHGEGFYNFQGLRTYKEKFDPLWEPRYLAGPGSFALPRVLTHVSTLVAGGLRGVLPR
jgi:phosphatidylglycerol lysyltransferase